MTDVLSQTGGLAGLIRCGEGQKLELKRSLRQLNRALVALCGMLNANGGEATIVFGVEPDGRVVGIDPANLASARRSLSRAIQNNMEPRLRPRLEVSRLDGKTLLVLHAKRPPSVPLYECHGRTYIRVGSQTLRMSAFERAALTERRRGGAVGRRHTVP